MIAVRYHPILAFALIYVPGLLLFVAFLGLAGALSPRAGELLHRVANIVPLLIAAFAAWRAAVPDGGPIFHFTGYDPKAQRASFRLNVWPYAIAYGVFAVLTDLTMVVIAILVRSDGEFHYSILRLWGIAGVYAVAARYAIERALTTPGEVDAEKVEDEDEVANTIPELWVLRHRDR